MANKTYIVDWGKDATGGRYALIQATTLGNAWMDADAFGSPAGIKELKIKKDCDEIRYMEFDAIDAPFAGLQVDKATNNKWYTSSEMFMKVYK